MREASSSTSTLTVFTGDFLIPWNDLANEAYCSAYYKRSQSQGGLEVDCAPVGGVQVPYEVTENRVGLAGALPPSIGELGPSVTDLRLSYNAITSLPSEIAALTGLRHLNLIFNVITSLPIEFRYVNPSNTCRFYGNMLNSCANIGEYTSCCTGDELLEEDSGQPVENRDLGTSGRYSLLPMGNNCGVIFGTIGPCYGPSRGE